MDFFIYYLKFSIDILLNQPPFESAQLIPFVVAKPQDITFKSAQLNLGGGKSGYHLSLYWSLGSSL